MSILAPKKATDDPAPAVWLPNSRHAKVRTYRGKSLEALLPRIRKDLGEDAVILREREGLMGGVGGFFATRFIEIEARAGGPSIDVYDEEGAESAPEDAVLTSDGFAAEELPDHELVISGPASPLSGAGFSASLDEALQAGAVEGAAPAPAATVAVTFPVADGPGADGPAAAPAGGDRPVRGRGTAGRRAKHRPAATPTAAATPATTGAAPSPAPKRAGTAGTKTRSSRPAAAASVADAVPARAEDPIPEIEFIATAPRSTAAPGPAAAVAPTRDSAAAEDPAPAPHAAAAAAPTPRAIDRAAAARISARLVDVGMSAAAVEELVASAAAHGAAVAGGLRAAVRAEIARRLLPAPLLSLEDPALAFVGAGGSGKSVAAAALAATYRYGSTLPVQVLSLSDAHGHRSLVERLLADEVPVTAAPTERREPGLLIVDTPAASPGDPAEVGVLGTRLDRLGLDAVLLVLPATIGMRAARRALSAFSPLGLTGLVISHRDESDAIGAIVELAIAAGLPVVYATSSGDHRRSLIAVSPAELAQDLLP
ncbi:MAG TPA: hypothetical protein VFN48_01350 [Solirubrobacteraceae bacterium]|nr:hypothetical protein [Solirubrobacteraceae bacterium]